MYNTRILSGSARCVALLLCALGPRVAYAVSDWQLSADDLARLDRREVLLPPRPEAKYAESSFRAAIEIDAPAAQVFRTMTDCAQALQFVPHLLRCAVLETAPDRSWQIIEHEVTYGWFLPHASYVFRAEYEPSARVHFSGVAGDFVENEGDWRLAPRRAGAATVVTYQAQVLPRFYVPRWLALASLKRDLPALLLGLRAHCESP
jgi:uncharacterized protein YndB with AHSA1/START domain